MEFYGPMIWVICCNLCDLLDASFLRRPRHGISKNKIDLKEAWFTNALILELNINVWSDVSNIALEILIIEYSFGGVEGQARIIAELIITA